MVEEAVVEVGDEVEDLEEVSSGGGGPYDKNFLLRVKAGETAVALLFVAKMLLLFFEKNENLRSEPTPQFIQPC